MCRGDIGNGKPVVAICHKSLGSFLLSLSWTPHRPTVCLEVELSRARSAAVKNILMQFIGLSLTKSTLTFDVGLM